MSTDPKPSPMSAARRKRPRSVNVRTPEVMQRVQAEVESHYRSNVVEKMRERGGIITIGNTTVRLARQFGFCYGVERAIDLAYAARKVFKDQEIYLIGEIIHNPEVNRQLREMGIKNLAGDSPDASIDDLGENDIVIVPAFGAETQIMDQLQEQGCMIVDTTCGDVMSVWKRVRQYARSGLTSIIHGKSGHEETRATASRALGEGDGHYLVILTLGDADYLCDYIRNGGDREDFLHRFRGAFSEGFDPDLHLRKVGVANQTTMLKGETEELQRRIAAAVADRDAKLGVDGHFMSFDTICGATQERQDALYDMLKAPMDMLLVVGGYNSSNTTHLVEIAQEKLPTFFIRDAGCLRSLGEILNFDLERRHERSCYSGTLLDLDQPVVVGITAGASCPNNLIEDTILRVFGLRGVERQAVLDC